jgi:hypothetical protein
MLSLICGDCEVVTSILEPMRKSAISKAKLVLLPESPGGFQFSEILIAF